MLKKIASILMAAMLCACIFQRPTDLKCRNLREPKDIGELLHQLYTNIDSTCLFEMPVEQLGKIWGITVIDGDDESWAHKRDGAKHHQSCTNRIDGLFIVISNNEKRMEIETSDCYLSKFRGMNTDEKLVDYIKYNRFSKKSIQPALDFPSGTAIDSAEYEAGNKLEYDYSYRFESSRSGRSISILHFRPYFSLTRISIH